MNDRLENAFQLQGLDRDRTQSGYEDKLHPINKKIKFHYPRKPSIQVHPYP